MQKFPQISEAEYEVMKVIWEKAPVSTNDICATLSPSHSWSSKTIHTMLSRLTAKKAVTYEKKQRMYYYSPLISKEDYRTRENRSFLDRFYDGQMGTMFSTFLKEEDVSKEELSELYELLSQKLQTQNESERS